MLEDSVVIGKRELSEISTNFMSEKVQHLLQLEYPHSGEGTV